MTDREMLQQLVSKIRDMASFHHGHLDYFHVSDWLREAEAHLKGKEFCNRCRGNGYYFDYRGKSYMHKIDCENPACKNGLVDTRGDLHQAGVD